MVGVVLVMKVVMEVVVMANGRMVMVMVVEEVVMVMEVVVMVVVAGDNATMFCGSE